MLSLAHIGLAGSFGALVVGWLVGGRDARAVSRKIPIYFMYSIFLFIIIAIQIQRVSL